MRVQAGTWMLVTLALASGCTKQSAGLGGSSGTQSASTPESLIIQQAVETPAGQATLPVETAGATSITSGTTPIAAEAPAATGTTAAVPASSVPSAAPVAPIETAAAPAVTAAKSALGSPREIQRALQQAGFYHGSIDGKIGPKTQSAIKEFQQAHQLKADGKVGPKTWAAMQTYLTASASSAQ